MLFSWWWGSFYNCTRACDTLNIDTALQWRHNERDGVSNHQTHDCLLNRLFRRRSKKTSKLRVTGLCAGNSPVTGEFPAQRASNAENVSIWWHHHGLSDVHHIVLASSKIYVPMTRVTSFTCWSSEHFDESAFQDDVSRIPFHVAEVFDDVSDSYFGVSEMLMDVLNHHAPIIKKGRRRWNHAPFMHSELRKAINVKAMLRRRYYKNRTANSWENTGNSVT